MSAFPVVLCGGSNGTAYFSGLWSSGRLPSGAHPVRVVTRRPERFNDALEACLCDARGRLNFETTPYPQADRLRLALDAAQSVPTDTLAAATLRQLSATPGVAPARLGPAVAQAIERAREQAIASALNAVNPST